MLDIDRFSSLESHSAPRLPRVARHLRSIASVVSLILVSGLGLLVGAVPASGYSTVLCTGYAGCSRAGMSNAGYSAARDTMWWRMYTGHNCTNYVAYRMVRAGMPNVRPWSGGGNASNWGLAERAITNSVPAVGSVAWWGAYSGGHGRAGHVAYVERVVSADEIIVSQDSWGGDFSWARISRYSGSWPSGFVHFRDLRLTSTSRPRIAGLPKVGAVLSATPGTWSPADPTISYQWRADGHSIPNATGTTLSLTQDLLGKQIAVRVVAAKLGYPTVRRFSVRTAAVLPGVLSSTTAPTVTGTAQVGTPLVASPGTWDPAPDALAYQWTADGTPIEGATTATLTPDATVLGKALAVTVTATRSGYTDVAAVSAATAPVVPGTFSVTGPPRVLVPSTEAGKARPGQTMSLDLGSFTPGDAQVTVQWLRAGRPVPDSTGPTYPITDADIGSRIAARVTLTKDGYTTVTTRTPSTRLVRAAPTLVVRTDSPHRGRLHLVATVAAQGVPDLSGVVRFRSRGQVVDVPVRHGVAATTLRGLPSRAVWAKVRYLGSREATALGVRRPYPVS